MECYHFNNNKCQLSNIAYSSGGLTWVEKGERKCVIWVGTWWYLADCSGMPAVTLIAVGTLDKNGTVAETLGKDLPANVVQPDAATYRIGDQNNQYMKRVIIVKKTDKHGT